MLLAFFISPVCFFPKLARVSYFFFMLSGFSFKCLLMHTIIYGRHHHIINAFLFLAHPADTAGSSTLRQILYIGFPRQILLCGTFYKDITQFLIESRNAL